LANRLGYSKNQVLRLLRTAEGFGAVACDPETGCYRLGPLLYELSHVAMRGMTLVAAAQDVLDDLWSATNETVHLFERDGLEALCVDRRESSRPIRLSAQIGRRLPLYAGACPKAILAHLPAEDRRAYYAATRLEPFTPRTLVDPGTLERDLADIRDRGYSVSDEDLDEGARAVAAPIFGRDGTVVGALSVAGPSSRMGSAELARYRPAVVAAARAISRRLGWDGADGAAARAGDQRSGGEQG
jgi:DNA-binding IclR family transcriptional regulator